MYKKILLFIILSILFTIFIGCNQNTQSLQSESIKLYFGDANNEKFVEEERTITYSDNNNKYQVALKELLNGPNHNEFRNNIPQGTEVKEIIYTNGDVTVNFNSEFPKFGGSIGEIIGVGSVVKTLTQFDEVKRIKLLVEGEELVAPSGNPYGWMSKKEEQTNNNPRETRNVTLYFGGDQALFVSPEVRSLEVDMNISQPDFIKRILEELIKGPTKDHLHVTIPKEVKVLSVDIHDNTAFVDFSEEMHTKHWHGAAGESMTVNSIVNTLTEFDSIQYVKMTVEGKPLFIEHMILDKPVSRNEDMIKND